MHALSPLLLCVAAFAGTRASAPVPGRGVVIALPQTPAGLQLTGAAAGLSLPEITFDGQGARVQSVPALPTPVARMSSPGERPGTGLTPSDGGAKEALTPQANVPAPAAATPTPLAEPLTPAAWKAAVPNAITALNLASGVGAILAASSGAFALAAALIVLANVFDALDGRAARVLGVSSELGVQLDSLADVVSFGAAPAVLAYMAGLSALGPVGFAVAAGFAAAGAYRLARFNVGVQMEKDGRVPPKPGDHFTGMPIPGGAGVVASAVLAAPALGAAAPVVLAVVTAVTAAAMVSRLPYPAFKKGGAQALLLPAAFALAVVASLWAAGASLFIPAALFGAFLLTGPAIWAWSGGSDEFKREFRRKAFHQLTLAFLPAYFLIPDAHRFWAFGACAAAIGLIELARLKWTAAAPFFKRYFGGIIREKEHRRFSGSFYASLGAFATVALFGADPLAVAGGILAMGLADSASPLVGLRFGVGRFKLAGTQRSVDGALAGFAVALLIALVLGFSPMVALLAALVFSAVDIYPVKPDDNLWIPVAFSAALFLLPKLL